MKNLRITLNIPVQDHVTMGLAALIAGGAGIHAIGLVEDVPADVRLPTAAKLLAHVKEKEANGENKGPTNMVRGLFLHKAKLTTHQIGEATQLEPRQVSSAIVALQRTNFIKRIGQGLYERIKKSNAPKPAKKKPVPAKTALKAKHIKKQFNQLTADSVLKELQAMVSSDPNRDDHVDSRDVLAAVNSLGGNPQLTGAFIRHLRNRGGLKTNGSDGYRIQH